MDTSGKISGISSFQTYIGDYQLCVNFDSLGGLLIDLTNSQRTVFRRKAIVKKEEIRQITGLILFLFITITNKLPHMSPE